MANTPGTLVETSKFPLRDETGAIVGTFGYSRDVTDWAVARRELALAAEEASRAHAQLMVVEAQLRDLLDSSRDAIAQYDTALRCQYVNPAAVADRGVRPRPCSV